MLNGTHKNSIGSQEIFENETITAQIHEENPMRNEITNGKNDGLNVQVEGQQRDTISREPHMAHGNSMEKNEAIVSREGQENTQEAQGAKKGQRALVTKLPKLVLCQRRTVQNEIGALSRLPLGHLWTQARFKASIASQAC